MNAAKKMKVGNRLYAIGLCVKLFFLAMYGASHNTWFILPAFLGLVTVVVGLAFKQMSESENKYNMYYGIRD